MPVALGAQRDDAGGELPRRLCTHRAVDDRVRPLAVEVDVVAGGVEVPGADARRAAADLGELQPLRPEEPLHVRRAGADPERLDHPLAHLPHLLVVRHRVEPVRRDVLRRDPARPHRLEHVGEVVAHEVGGRTAVDGHRVVEALVALDVLLDRDRVDALSPKDDSTWPSWSWSSTRVVSAAPAPLRGLRISGNPTAFAKSRTWSALSAAVDAAVGTPDGAQRVLHRRLVAAEVRRAHRRPGDGARLAHLRDRQDVRLDGGLQTGRPRPGPGSSARRRSSRRRPPRCRPGGSGASSPGARRRAPPPATRRCRSPPHRPRPAPGRTRAGSWGSWVRRRSPACQHMLAGLRCGQWVPATR